ncbi:Uncharacterised protein [uncultured archaeon]|nr:Uncharacterised protein [uncultured archaeon]
MKKKINWKKIITIGIIILFFLVLLSIALGKFENISILNRTP